MPYRIKNITSGEIESGSLGQPDLLVMPQTPPNKKALLNEQGLEFDSAAASYFSLSSLSRATSTTWVLSLIAGEWSSTYLSTALSNRSGKRIEIGMRISLDIRIIEIGMRISLDIRILPIKMAFPILVCCRDNGFKWRGDDNRCR